MVVRSVLELAMVVALGGMVWAALRRLAAGRIAVPRCSSCGGAVSRAYPRCRHCGANAHS